MDVNCMLIGFNDESMETTIKRVKPYKGIGASYYHMISRSAIVDGNMMKFSQLVTESISRSTGMKSDLSIYRMPNMAVHYLMHYLKNYDIKIEPINNYNFGKQRIKEVLLSSQPLLVGISSTCIVEAAPIKEVVDYVRSFNKDVKIVVGGPFINSINYEYEEQQQKYLLSLMGADIYIHERQGEKTLLALYKELSNPCPDLSKVPNILYKSDNDFIRTEKIAENISLDEEPVKKLTFYPNHILPPVYVRTAISCSLQCAFCRYPILGGEMMYQSIKSIEKNLNYIDSLGVKYLVFIDDSFNIPIKRFKEILRMMIRNKYQFRWFSFFRISHSDDEVYELMEASGCLGVLLGMESGSDTILKNMDKRVTTDKFAWGIQKLTEHNIISYASCMIGFPGETEKTAKETIQFIQRTKPTFYDLQCWFYENAVPISKEKQYHNLEGYGYSWSHNTMNSETAAKIVAQGISEIENSCFMPSLSFNLWSLGYYLSQGATLEEFKEFTRIFKRVVSYEKEIVDDKYNEEIDRLMHVFANNKDLYNNLKMRHKE